MESKYCYENGTLINNKEIHDYEKFKIEEQRFSLERISLLRLIKEKIDSDNYESAVSMIISAFNLKDKSEEERMVIVKWVIGIFNSVFSTKTYLNIHRFIFSDFYPFAGEIRDEAIYKENTPYFQNKTSFCYPSFIYSALNRILSDMSLNAFRVKNKEILCKYIGKYYGELNMVHPFREGNGRTLRLYIELLIDYFNQYLERQVYIDYTKLDKEELRKATIISSVTGDYSYIEEIFNSIIIEKSRKRI